MKLSSSNEGQEVSEVKSTHQLQYLEVLASYGNDGEGPSRATRRVAPTATASKTPLIRSRLDAEDNIVANAG
jgi:hypothetical protein